MRYPSAFLFKGGSYDFNDSTYHTDYSETVPGIP